MNRNAQGQHSSAIRNVAVDGQNSHPAKGADPLRISSTSNAVCLSQQKWYKGLSLFGLSPLF